MRPADRILSLLRRRGLLLEQDRTLPSVVGALTGEALRTSWWSHPKGRLVFAVLSELDDRPDVLFTKLLRGKTTLVQRRLWPALAAVGAAREPWQIASLSPAAHRALGRVERGEDRARATGAVARELASRLLVVARQIHTESGRHETVLESWAAWSRRAKCRPLASVARAKRALERAAVGLGAGPTDLPWNRFAGRTASNGASVGR